jgi:uncharacterized protein
MSERIEYAPGTPSWTDHASPDPGAAAEFYTALFAWETENRMPPDADGEYHMATLRGKEVAALGSQPMEGVPPTWNTYVTVASADDAAAAVKDGGGTVVMDPFDVFESGRMAVCSDPAGAFFMVWEPMESIGAELVNEPGTMSWNELITNDVEGAKRFYGEALGWQTTSMEGGPGPYTIWHPPGVEPKQGPQEEGGNGVGGLMSSEQLPPGTPPFWMVYFAVDDADATVAKAEELGGSVMAPAFDTPVGRIAVLNDAQGAVFSVIAMSDQS